MHHALLCLLASWEGIHHILYLMAVLSDCSPGGGLLRILSALTGDFGKLQVWF